MGRRTLSTFQLMLFGLRRSFAREIRLSSLYRPAPEMYSWPVWTWATWHAAAGAAAGAISPDSPWHKECNGGESEGRRGHRDLMRLRAAWATAMVTMVGSELLIHSPQRSSGNQDPVPQKEIVPNLSTKTLPSGAVSGNARVGHLGWPKIGISG